MSLERGGRALVESLSLEVAPGQITAVVGPNGAGKSTLLRLLAGEIAPSAGEVRIEGRPLAGFAPWQLACRRAVMPQAARFAFAFTVFEVARLGVEGVGRGLSGCERDRIAGRALERADLAALAGRRIDTLSGGERQRANLARVLAQLEAGRTLVPATGQVLLMDEPVAALDLKHQLGLIEEARRLAESGVAVLVVLHDLQLAAAAADFVLVLRQGRAAAAGRPSEVLTRQVIAEAFEVDLLSDGLPPPPWVLPRRASGERSTAAGEGGVP